MLRDGHTTAGTITLTPDAEDGLWTDEELTDSSMFINKLTVAREYAGHNLGGRLLDWAGDRACRAGARWLRLDAWTTSDALQRYYLEQGFTHVRTAREGTAVNGAHGSPGGLRSGRQAWQTTDSRIVRLRPPASHRRPDFRLLGVILLARRHRRVHGAG